MFPKVYTNPYFVSGNIFAKLNALFFVIRIARDVFSDFFESDNTNIQKRSYTLRQKPKPRLPLHPHLPPGPTDDSGEDPNSQWERVPLIPSVPARPRLPAQPPMPDGGVDPNTQWERIPRAPNRPPPRGDVSQSKFEIWRKHNEYRRLHRTPPLAFNPDSQVSLNTVFTSCRYLDELSFVHQFYKLLTFCRSHESAKITPNT